MTNTDQSIYEALAIPNDALEKGGLEILRAGLIADELYVTARRVFKDPARWGEVLAEIAQRIAQVYAAEDTNLRESEILAEILEAFAADFGARKIGGMPEKRKSAARGSKKRRARQTAAARRPAARKSAKRKPKRVKR